MSDRRKWAIPVAVVGVALAGSALMIATSPPLESATPDRSAVVVRVVDPAPGSARLVVRSQGTVVPRTESDLIPEVSGPVVWVSPALVSGGFFEAGEPLLRVDPRDYRAAAARARAQLARAEGEQEHAVATLARQDQLSHRSVASQSQHDDARRAARVAEASLAEARVAVGQALRDLERTEIRAPFAGRVRSERVDVGQFVSRGMSIGTLYATDYVEIRLPIPDAKLAYLELPLWNGAGTSEEGPPVTLRAHFAGGDHRWSGRIVRTEGEIDAKSRVVHIVARVEHPYGLPGGGSDETAGDEDATDRPPLAVGLFVHAEIQGPMVENVDILPRAALREDETVLVVDRDDRIRSRPVELVRIDRDDVLIRAELEPGDRFCLTALQVVVDGMKVQVVSAKAPTSIASGLP